METEFVLQFTSPNGNIEAFVEQDKRVCFFYLRAQDESLDFGMKTCWVRNLVEAPTDESAAVEDMQAGLPPLLQAEFCLHPEGAPPLAEDDLRIVWFEEGDAAALLEGDQILAVIPAWSGFKGFHGYARDCRGQSPLCWELGTPDKNAMFDRINRAEAFWASWSQEENPWTTYQGQALAVYEKFVGEHAKYYAIDGDDWPPKALIRATVGDAEVMVTLGVCVRPQPGVEGTVDRPEDHRRIELAACLPAGLADDEVLRMGGYLSAQTNLPWSLLTWLGDGHTIPCDATPASLGGERFPAALLVKDPPGAPSLALPDFRDDPVNLLWVIPITDAQRKEAIEGGSDALKEKLWADGVTWRFEER